MFRKEFHQFAGSESHSCNPVGWTNGAAKIEGKESHSYNFIAIGSQDRTITVWTTASTRPLFVAKHFLIWSRSSYAYSLFACSLDGTVAKFYFDVKEIGHKLSDAELDELKRGRYGDVRGQQSNLAESPAQLLLEAASAKQTTSKKVALDVQQNQIPVESSLDLGVPNKSSQPQNNDGKESGLSASDGLTVTAAQVSSPVKQREYKRADRRKRIIPEAVVFLFSRRIFVAVLNLKH